MPSKPRGRLTAYSFFVRRCKEEHRNKFPYEEASFSEFSRKCGARWVTMSEQAKKVFHALADRDKARYEAEMQQYTSGQGQLGKKPGKPVRKTPSPGAPRRCRSAFSWFCTDERDKVKGMHPELGAAEVKKQLSRLWNLVGPEVTQKYDQLAQKDKVRYYLEMAEYKKKQMVITDAGVARVLSAGKPPEVKEGDEMEVKEEEEIEVKKEDESNAKDVKAGDEMEVK